MTSAGSAAGIDLLLHLVRKDYGPKVANSFARRMVVPPHRDGGQSQFVVQPIAVRTNDRIASVADWMAANLSDEITIELLADRAAMSVRSFTPLPCRDRRGADRMAGPAARAPRAGPPGNQRFVGRSDRRRRGLRRARNVAASFPESGRDEPVSVAQYVSRQGGGWIQHDLQALLVIARTAKRDEAIQFFLKKAGLLRFARNDEESKQNRRPLGRRLHVRPDKLLR